MMARNDSLPMEELLVRGIFLERSGKKNGRSERLVKNVTASVAEVSNAKHFSFHKAQFNRPFLATF